MKEMKSLYTIEYVEEIKKYTTHYYMIKINVSNQSSDTSNESGISLFNISLVGTNYYMLLDSEIFALVNPDMPGTDFSL